MPLQTSPLPLPLPPPLEHVSTPPPSPELTHFHTPIPPPPRFLNALQTKDDMMELLQEQLTDLADVDIDKIMYEAMRPSSFKRRSSTTVRLGRGILGEGRGEGRDVVWEVRVNWELYFQGGFLLVIWLHLRCLLTTPTYTFLPPPFFVDREPLILLHPTLTRERFET